MKNIGNTDVIREFRAASHSSLVVRVSRMPKLETVETKKQPNKQKMVGTWGGGGGGQHIYIYIFFFLVERV